ncbi:hypothetical protein OWV82_003273 [Melia azedarach]|uniref:Uncharacterized protein n=1 Tax=Melia azedarach TaxID=155640 RepID=A0ACC1YKP7_MELAZ|nr:hypothetical protein OWV82_003273 [Melia azedarach]
MSEPLHSAKGSKLNSVQDEVEELLMDDFYHPRSLEVLSKKFKDMNEKTKKKADEATQKQDKDVQSPKRLLAVQERKLDEDVEELLWSDFDNPRPLRVFLEKLQAKATKKVSMEDNIAVLQKLRKKNDESSSSQSQMA